MEQKEENMRETEKKNRAKKARDETFLGEGCLSEEKIPNSDRSRVKLSRDRARLQSLLVPRTA
jgi:hypothetical protein